MIKCNFTMSKAINKKINRINFDETSLKPLIVIEIISFFAIIALIVFKEYEFAIIFGVMMVFFPAFIILLAVYNSNKKYKSYALARKNPEYSIEFMDETLSFFISTGDNDSKITLRYDEIYKIIKTDSYLFIFVNKTDSLPVDLFKITEGSADELVALLKEKTNKIYGLKKY